MRVLVCGGRGYQNYNKVKDVLNALGNISIVIHGGAHGADTLADRYAAEINISSLQFDALWDKHGRSAGPIRNQRMLDEGKPDLVVAFPGGKGTAHMVNIAKKAGVKVIEISD